MNKLVMNFLVTEGYVDAAEKFRKESGTERILFLYITYGMFLLSMSQWCASFCIICCVSPYG